jgi:hypothetical protein
MVASTPEPSAQWRRSKVAIGARYWRRRPTAKPSFSSSSSASYSDAASDPRPAKVALHSFRGVLQPSVSTHRPRSVQHQSPGPRASRSRSPSPAPSPSVSAPQSAPVCHRGSLTSAPPPASSAHRYGTDVLLVALLRAARPHRAPLLRKRGHPRLAPRSLAPVDQPTPQDPQVQRPSGSPARGRSVRRVVRDHRVASRSRLNPVGHDRGIRQPEKTATWARAPCSGRRRRRQPLRRRTLHILQARPVD